MIIANVDSSIFYVDLAIYSIRWGGGGASGLLIDSGGSALPLLFLLPHLGHCKLGPTYIHKPEVRYDVQVHVHLFGYSNKSYSKKKS